MKSSGELVREARKIAGLTQEDLARELGLRSAQYISNAERKEYGVSPKYFKRLSDLLNIPLQRLIDAHLQEYTDHLIRRIG